MRGFHTTAVARSSSLVIAIKEAEQALEQLKHDHDRAASDASASSAEQRRLALRVESAKAQAEATAALRAQVSEKKKRAGRGDEGTVLEDAGPEMQDWFLMPAARVGQVDASQYPLLAAASASTRPGP